MEFLERLRRVEDSFGLDEQSLRKVGANRELIFERLQNAIGGNKYRLFDLPNGNLEVQVLEAWNNPTESHYDRAMSKLLWKLEQDGRIKPGSVVLETSSGNAGISFAWIAGKLGYEGHVFMPGYLNKPRIEITKELLGDGCIHLLTEEEECEIYLHTGRSYMAASAYQMKEYFLTNRQLVVDSGRDIWMANHSQENITVKTFSTIADVALNAGYKPDYFVGAIGNATTLKGIGTRLKEFNECCVVGFTPNVGVGYYNEFHPDLVFGRLFPGLVTMPLNDNWVPHVVPGTGVSGSMRFKFLDEVINTGFLEDVLLLNAGEILGLNEPRLNSRYRKGDQVGNSSILASYVAEEIAKEVSGKVIMTVAYDRKDRY